MGSAGWTNQGVSSETGRVSRPSYHDAGLTIIFSRRGLDDGASFRGWAWVKLSDKAPHALVAGGEAASVDQILPDRHGVTTTREPDFNYLPVRRAGACGWTATRVRFGDCGGADR